MTELGCYADGTFGHQHTREGCAVQLLFHGCEDMVLIEALHGEMSDDAWEEIEAIDWLNENAAVPSATWAWQDGDFGLWPIPEEPEA